MSTAHHNGMRKRQLRRRRQRQRQRRGWPSKLTSGAVQLSNEIHWANSVLCVVAIYLHCICEPHSFCNVLLMSKNSNTCWVEKDMHTFDTKMFCMCKMFVPKNVKPHLTRVVCHRPCNRIASTIRCFGIFGAMQSSLIWHSQ